MLYRNSIPKYIIMCIILFFCKQTFSQETTLYLPLDIQEAYQKGTRTFAGIPGKQYWQNHAEYKIQVELLPYLSVITGDAQITYFNNSPDSLTNIVVRLYPDIYKKGTSRQFSLGTDDLTDGTDIHYLSVDGVKIDLEGEDSPVTHRATNMDVRLTSSLPPAQSVQISIGWSFNIPKTRKLRMGQYSNTDFFIAYWYPQIAVYDDINGWDRIAYQGRVEFYNDFNDYDVSITVPGDFVVWATGTLQNISAVLKPEIVQRYKKAAKSDQVVKIITAADYLNSKVTQNNLKNNWQFKAEKVTDFSFATSNHYLWDAASVEVDSNSHRRVVTAVAYPDSTVHYQEGAFFSQKTIEYLSNKLPGIAYPYPHVTTFCNGGKSGGMETPMMANNGAPQRRESSISLIFHEISHNYFPFYMGTNEKKYAWMDEGWASFFPREIVESLEPEYDYLKKRIENYTKEAGMEDEVELMIPSNVTSEGRYRIAAYDRPAVAYFMLKDLLGEALFKKALQEFIRQWAGKHPIPYDFFFTFEAVSGQNLDWFWKPWFFERGYPDLAISSVTSKGSQLQVLVEKVGNFPIPISLNFYSENGIEKSVTESINVWQDGKRQIELTCDIEIPITKITLGNEHIPDVNTENNVFEIGSMETILPSQ